MQTRPEVAAGEGTRRTIVRVQRRMLMQHLLEGAVIATALAALAVAVARGNGWAVSPMALPIGAAAVVSSWLLARAGSRGARAAAARVERHAPESRNLIITVHELLEHPRRGAPWMRTRVLSDADRITAGLAVSTIVPLRSQLISFVAAAGALAAAAAAPSGARVTPSIPERTEARAASGAGRILVALRPPAHTNLPAETLIDPDRITAVEGTVARLTFPAAGAASRVRFGATPVPLSADPADRSRRIAELTLAETGYLAVEGAARAPVLIPLTVVPDGAPSIRIEQPGRDLLLPDAERTVAVRATAADDFGLATLSLRYTKVSGSGEQYEFTEGEAPLEIVRSDPRSWRGNGVLPLNSLGLQRGDSLVYRVVARDARPGDRGFSSSDTFVVEVAGPGEVALEGFEMPSERERYALSQQMIVLKIERLRAREKRLAEQRLRDETTAIAAEQRAVRGNFIFLTGGHVEDEEEEAEGSHEIQEGRLENTARREITAAIAHMMRAEQALASVATGGALVQARLAADALQRAFGRNRYILRALPVRSRVDPSRRLTGRLDEASGWTREVHPAAAGARAQAIEALLTTMIAAHRRLEGTVAPGDVPSGQELLERALSIDPGAAEWQTIASHLAKFANASAGGAGTAEPLRHLNAAMSLILERGRALVPRQRIPLASSDALRAAWAEEERRK